MSVLAKALWSKGKLFHKRIGWIKQISLELDLGMGG